MGHIAMETKLFFSTYVLIFVAELPDKTAFAALLLATSHHPLAVFIGAGGAFLIQSLVAVTFGSLLSFLPSHLIHISASILFLVFAVLMWRKGGEEAVSSPEKQTKIRFSQSVSAAFWTIFIAEWGDLTQLATATLAAKYNAPITIFTSSILALWTVTAIGVIVGYKIKYLFPGKMLQKIAASAFAVIGVVLLLKH
jgi:putative Ca2+/H+ antiporter (TMEM165/GDT1 family)